MILKAKEEEFRKLFDEFASEFLKGKVGQENLSFYAKGRHIGRASFEEIRADASNGADITDRVLQKLLPHTDTASHRASGVWIHIAPAIQGDIREWFEGAGWTHSEDWPKVAQAILTFVSACADDPTHLDQAAKVFAELPFTTGLQTGMLTPILNAVRPDNFIIVNNKSRKVINYFCGENFRQSILDYKATNEAGRSLIAAMTPLMQELGGNDVLPADLFDMFCHWLVGVRKYPPLTDHKVKAGTKEVPASAPEEPSLEAKATPSADGASEPRQSYKIQAALAEIGIKLGFRVWVPKSDRQAILELVPTPMRESFVDDLPLSYDGTTLKTIKNIDVIWLKKHSMERAFEVEHTTAIYSGLLRMADLLALVPGLTIPLHIAAPHERREQVRQEILRPTFLGLKPKPLYEVCSFLPYSAVEELLALPNLEHMKETIIDKYRVVFGDEEDI
jgi:hypothetical protein